MEESKIREVPKEVKRYIYRINGIGVLAGVLVVWVVFGLKYFGIIPPSEEMEGDFEIILYFSIAVAAVIIGIITFLVLVKKALAFARKGIAVKAAVQGAGSGKLAKMVYAYEYNGVSYTGETTVSNVELEKYNEEGVDIIIDPDNPKKSILMTEIYAWKKEEKENNSD